MSFPAVSGAQKGTGEGRGGHCVRPVDLLFLGLPWPFRALHGTVSSVVGVARGGEGPRTGSRRCLINRDPISSYGYVQYEVVTVRPGRRPRAARHAMTGSCMLMTGPAF